MKKAYFIALFALFCSSSFATMQAQLPQQIVCDKSQYCMATDDGIRQENWSAMTGTGLYVKPGTYVFYEAVLQGNPRDNFMKTVAFTYKSKDKDGYESLIEYRASGWFAAKYADKYRMSYSQGFCVASNIRDCDIVLFTPGN
jgi:hypothetical protein